MTWLEIIVIAILQGATEFFPVSSLGHAVILPALLGWGEMQSDAGFLAFLVILHFGTAAAILLYFWRDWIGLLAALAPNSGESARKARRMIAMLIIGTIPVALAGFLFNHPIKALFANPLAASLFLVLNAALLHFGERVADRPNADLARLTFRQAAVVGTMQCLALLPGISRSGATIVGGLLIGLSEAEAAHFSFLLATPAILGAGVLEIPKLLKLEHGLIDPTSAVIGGLIAGLIAYASIYVLMQWLKGHHLHALRPFAGYCLVLGALGLAIFGLT